MSVHHLPILICEDFSGAFTAMVVEADIAATAPTAPKAVEQLKDFLNWQLKRHPWAVPDGDFHEPRLQRFSIAVRPEYTMQRPPIGSPARRRGDDEAMREQVFPCEEVSLPAIAVLGEQRGGLMICALPLFGLRFFFHDATAVKGLVTHYVQQAFKGATPADLSRFLPPKDVILDDIVLRTPGRMRSGGFDESAATRTVAKVAEAIGDNTVRGRFSRAFERDSEIEDLARRVDEDRANVIVLGESGAGKTAVIVDAVARMERLGETKSRRANAKDRDDDGHDRPADDDHTPAGKRRVRRHWMTNAARLVAGMKYLGQWEDRCETIIDELGNIRGVLVIENLLDFVLTGGNGPGDGLAAFFGPFLQHGQLRMIVEATPDELESCRRLLPGFADLFQVLPLRKFNRRSALAVLDRLATALTRDTHVSIAIGVTDLIYRLFARFLPYRPFPGPAANFVSELVEQAQNENRSEVTADYAIQRFVRMTGLPELFLRDGTVLDSSSVAATFEHSVIGQKPACEAAADVVTIFKAGLNDPSRPIGVMLFCGPTGVGKTSLARAMSKFLFEHGRHKDRLIRLDMSEYAGFGAVDRLLGNPDGRPSELIRRLREQPFCVVLFDEIEKASPDIFDMLLGLLDEGRLADRFGRVTVFRSAIIILTSNLGADRQETLGYGTAPPAAYDAAVMRFFRPEFFNRIDSVVTFSALSAETIRAITAKELQDIGEREGLHAAEIRLEWSDRLVEFLAAEGFDPVYGARPLQRALERLVVSPIARFLVAHPGISRRVLSLDLDVQNQITITDRPR